MQQTVPKRFHELKEIGTLPSPTGVGMQILSLARSEETTAHEIARVVQMDPALTGKILQFANSLHAGSRVPIVTVNDAVIRLGVRAVSGVAVGFTVLSSYRSGPCKGFDYQGFWEHSLATAIAAEGLSRQTGILPPAEAFTSGLLSQIGKLALATLYPEEYAEMLKDCKDDSPERMVELERKLLATDYREMGANLLKHWGLPALFANIVLHHERPDEFPFTPGSEENEEALLIGVASQLAGVCLAEEGQRKALTTELEKRGERLKIDSTVFINLGEEIVGQWQQWGQLFGVETRPLLPLRDSTKDSKSRLRILLVEDDPTTSQVLTAFLTSVGHSVVSANNGQEGLARVLETNPQLVIADWVMPEMDGLELCKSIRRTEMGKSMYIIILTGQDQETHVVQAFDAGADDFIVKPPAPRLLMARIRAGQRVIQLRDENARDKEEIYRNTQKLAILNRKLERSAFTDDLTDLPNRRYMIEFLNQVWTNPDRPGEPLACMILDVDHFKRVNDTYGHDVGDQVLKEVADIFRAGGRPRDVVCRYGGEEFVIICPNTNRAEAYQLAEGIRSGTERNTIAVPETDFICSVTVSIGLAIREEGCPDPDALLKAADEVLYAAKKRGRNRVMVYGG